MIKKTLFFVVHIILLIILTSCSNVIKTGIPTADYTTGYPAGQSSKPEVAYPVNSDGTDLSDTVNIQQKTYDINELPVAPDPLTPEEGKGSVSGVMFSASSRFTIPQTLIYLTFGWGDSQEEIPAVFMGPGKNDIVSQTDENGQFSINNIPPGKYYLLMAAPPYDWALGYIDSELTPLRVNIEPGTKIASGVVYVYWP